MYSEKVGHIYINKSKLTFKDEYGVPLEDTVELLEVGTPLTAIGNMVKYYPDYVVSGFFRRVNKDSANEFIISKDGPDIILVTGVPKEYPSLEPFRFKDSLFSSYYQDTVKGVLFQVFHKAPVILPVSKQISIMQL